MDGTDRLARHQNLIEPRRPVSPSGEQIELALGDQHAVITEVGAGLRSYFADGRDMVEGYAADELAPSGRGQLLIPWPNRIEDGSYEFGGGRHQLPLDEPERQNAIHGLVRWSAWRIAERETDSAALEHVLARVSGTDVEYGTAVRAAQQVYAERVRGDARVTAGVSR